jgi:hypothetical protein
VLAHPSWFDTLRWLVLKAPHDSPRESIGYSVILETQDANLNYGYPKLFDQTLICGA